MSAAAINPAPSPASGAAPAAGANASGQSGHAAQAQGPLAAFEAMLNTLFGAQGLGADGTAAKTGAKATPGTKTVTDDAKTKTDGDGKSATADATTAPDASLALLVPTLPTLPIVAAPAATDGTAAQPGAAGVADKSPGQTAAAVLAALASAAADGGKAKAAAPAALSVNGAATNTTAIAKVDAALAPKTDGTASPVAQPPSSQAQPATAIPAPPTPAVAVAAVVTPPTTTPIAAAAAVGAKDLEAKENVPAPKAGVRVDALKAEATPGAADALAPKTTAALQPISDGASKGDPGGKDAQQPAPEATTTANTSTTPGDPTTSSTTTAATLIHAATVAVRGAPQTVANLAAQIVKKLDGRSTQFDIQLDPAGLGKVDVRVAIGADGRMSAAMSFDTPQAAAELRSRAGELQRALEQSGFDLSGGMSFDVASDRGQGGQGGQAQNQQPDAGAAFRGRAFQAALGSTADTPPPQLTLRRTALAGVDIRI
jgi:flagellar hook-length control protein FliK